MILDWGGSEDYFGLQTLIRTWTNGGAVATATQRGTIDFDQIRSSARHGTGTQIQMFAGGPSSAGQFAIYDAAGNIIPGAAGSGSGSVTSVALTVPSRQSISGSPVTSAGTLAISDNTQNANLVFSGPTTGSPAAPTFRSLVAADVPSIAESQVTGLVTDLAAKSYAAAQSLTATSGTTSELDFTSWYDSACDIYDIVVEALVPSTTGLTLYIQCSTNGGSSYDTGSNYSYSHFAWSRLGTAQGGGDSQTQFQIAPLSGRTLVTGTNYTFSGTIRLYNPGGSNYKNFAGHMLGNDSSNSTAAQALDLRCWYLSTTAVDAFRVKISSGTFGGTVRVYKVAH